MPSLEILMIENTFGCECVEIDSGLYVGFVKNMKPVRKRNPDQIAEHCATDKCCNIAVVYVNDNCDGIRFM
jgi:hypothetical protein